MGNILEKKREKADKILDSAYDLFVSKGFENTAISDITKHAGVAKGTFYLYYKDKYQVRDRLIAIYSNELFKKSYFAMRQAGLADLEDQILFIVNHLIDSLIEDHNLLRVIAKNLSWGIFSSALQQNSRKDAKDILTIFQEMISDNQTVKIKDPEIMLFMIVELASACCFSTILDENPVSFDSIRPYLDLSIRSIIKNHTVADSATRTRAHTA